MNETTSFLELNAPIFSRQIPQKLAARLKFVYCPIFS